MGQPYDVSQGTLFVGVGPLVDAGKRRLFHGKATTGAIPRVFRNVTERDESKRGIQGIGGVLEASFILRSSPPPHTREDYR
jgi:hypothetical protein